jgi:carbonic anhydrase
MAHIADAAVVACIDFRFQKFIRTWIDNNLTGKTFDYIGWAGSTKNLDSVLEQIGISVRLHQIKQVVLIHHEECGAYGEESTPERHAEDLKKARAATLAKYPDLAVDLYYLHLDGAFEPVA